jgi:hypothetical protein
VRLNDVQGVVLHIGLRSTCLRTELNHELIVPNKNLLDEQVTNLTLSDNLVQTFVAVSVDRKVPLQTAKREMLKAAFLHPLVLKSPQPVVLLREVDSYWMTFEVHFSMEHYSFMKCSIVQSQILEQIADIVKPMEAAVAAESEAKSEGAQSEAAQAPPINDEGKLVESAAVGGPVQPGETGGDSRDLPDSLAATHEELQSVSNGVVGVTNGEIGPPATLAASQSVLASLTKLNNAALRKQVNGTHTRRRLGA